MVFYRINAAVLNFRMDDSNADEYKNSFQTNCEMFYQKCKHSVFLRGSLHPFAGNIQ